MRCGRGGRDHAPGSRRWTDNTLEFDGFVCFALYSATHALNRLYKPMLDELGLTYPQYLVMVTLWGQDDQTVGSIGEKLFVESSTLDAAAEAS